MAEFPKFPLWTDAYLGDTTHLTTIEHGAYLLLLIAMWRTADKALPNDDKLLARYARLTSGQWRRIKPILMPFFKIDGCAITQSRLTDEAIAVRQHSRKQSDKAKSRWLKPKETPEAAAVPEECPNDASLSLSLSHKKERAKALVRQVARFAEFWDSYPHRDGVKRNRATAEKKYRAHVKAGVAEDAILSGLARLMADKRVKDGFARDPTTWLNQRGWEDEATSSVASGKPPPNFEQAVDNLERGIRAGRWPRADLLLAAHVEALITRKALTREEAARRNFPLAADPLRRTA
jgi:uncharacterized protein YdaU (DUF1376 family)